MRKDKEMRLARCSKNERAPVVTDTMLNALTASRLESFQGEMGKRILELAKCTLNTAVGTRCFIR